MHDAERLAGQDGDGSTACQQQQNRIEQSGIDRRAHFRAHLGKARGLQKAFGNASFLGDANQEQLFFGNPISGAFGKADAAHGDALMPDKAQPRSGSGFAVVQILQGFGDGHAGIAEPADPFPKARTSAGEQSKLKACKVVGQRVQHGMSHH